MVKQRVKVAALQMVSGADLQKNLDQAALLLAKAASEGARVAVLPENFAVLDTEQMLVRGRAERTAEGPVRAFLAEQAKTHGIWVVGGSLPLAARPDDSPLEDRVRASCLLIDDQGQEVIRYDKIHLFDAQVEDSQGQYRESDVFESGAEVIVADTPAGRLGMTICYDLRFPELFRALREQNVDWVSLPSAFTWHTGNAHWHTLIRARAIENQFWMVAAGQGGQNSERRRTYGHSMIVDPWGRVVRELMEGAGVVMAEIDTGITAEIRQRMPVWGHRRL